MRTGEVIIIVDDDPKQAEWARSMLVSAGYVVAPVVTRGADLERALEEEDASLVLLDIELGEVVSGMELAERIPPEIPFLFISAHSDRDTLELAQIRRPAGFVVKPFHAEQLLAAVRIALTKRPSSTFDESLFDAKELEPLSAREREVLGHLLQNKRVRAIASMLFISQHTVRNHLKSAYAKLGVKSQQELIDRLEEIGNKRR